MSVALTEAAAKHIKQYAGEPRLRITVTLAGGKMVYQTAIITRILDSDYVYESKGVTLVVDNSSIPFLDGTEIDYMKEGPITGFKYNNPQENKIEFK
jgi:iron-sulfur cluster assembly protein